MSGPSAFALALLLVAPLLAVAGAPEYRVARTDASRDALLAGEADAWERATSIRWGPEVYEFRPLR